MKYLKSFPSVTFAALSICATSSFADISDAGKVVARWGSPVIVLGDVTGSPVANQLIFRVNTLDRASIDGNGNFAIGSSPAQSKLHVQAGNILLDNTKWLNFASNTGVAQNAIGLTSSNSLYFGGGSQISEMGWDINGGSYDMTFNSTGLGIGMVPGAKLDVSGNARVSGKVIGSYFTNNSNYATSVITAEATGTRYFELRDGGTVRAFIDPATTTNTAFFSQKVGIGIDAPNEKLEVVGGVKITDGPNGILKFYGDSEGGKIVTAKNQGGNRNLRFTNIDFYSKVETELVRFNADGSVGIGTDKPTKRLDVNGDANVSGSLTVGSVNTRAWTVAPDYVFEDDYKLSSLEQVESFVQKNKHLPEVPSAKEIKTKGLDLAEMNLVLLKKVEELTLHAIRQEKEMKRQATEIRRLKNGR